MDRPTIEYQAWWFKFLVDVEQVLVIQSCRKQTSRPPYTALATSRFRSHIDLTRPNTVLLLATVSGGKAYRGAFTGALSDQIKRADGKTGIHEMFQQAYSKLQTEHQTQTPVLISTLRKNLFLQPISNKMASKGVQNDTKERAMMSSEATIIPYWYYYDLEWLRGSKEDLNCNCNPVTDCVRSLTVMNIILCYRSVFLYYSLHFYSYFIHFITHFIIITM